MIRKNRKNKLLNDLLEPIAKAHISLQWITANANGGLQSRGRQGPALQDDPQPRRRGDQGHRGRTERLLLPFDMTKLRQPTVTVLPTPPERDGGLQRSRVHIEFIDRRSPPAPRPRFGSPLAPSAVPDKIKRRLAVAPTGWRRFRRIEEVSGSGPAGARGPLP
jgi:hypothetical protein